MAKKRGFCPFLMGGLVGLGLGFLFAPKRGIELREQLFEKAMDILTDSQSIKEDVTDFIKTFRNEEGEVEIADEIVISRDFDENHEDITL